MPVNAAGDEPLLVPNGGETAPAARRAALALSANSRCCRRALSRELALDELALLFALVLVEFARELARELEGEER